MKRVLLVYPEFREQTFWSFKECMRVIGKQANMPPYGLITVAAMLPKDYILRLVDQNVRRLKDRDIVELSM